MRNKQCQCNNAGLQPDFFLLRMQIGVSAMSDELEQTVSLKVETAQSFKTKNHGLGVWRLTTCWGC